MIAGSLVAFLQIARQRKQAVAVERDILGTPISSNGPVPASSGGPVTIFRRDGPPIQATLVNGTAVPNKTN